MSLTTVIVHNSVSLFNLSAPVSALSSPVIGENAPSCRNTFLTEQEISLKTELFVQHLYQNISSDDKKLKLSPLRKIFNRMIQGHDQTIKQALKKPNGYLYRLFSNESWEEWIEQKTALGKVTSIFVDYVESEFPFKDLPSYLDFETLLKANAQAENLLKQLSESSKREAKAPLDNPQENILKDSDCSVGLALGAVGALTTQNPIPLGIAGLNCLSSVQAVNDPVRFNDHIILNPGQSWFMEAHHKIVLCKKKHNKCDYHGPNLKVTIINTATNQVLYNGPFSGDREFNTARKVWDTFTMCHYWHEEPLSILVENDTNEQAAMYVFVE